MNLSKIDKVVYVGMPWFFGMVLVVTGGLFSNAHPEKLQGIILISAGLICVSMYCVAALLAKVVQRG